MLKVIQIGMGPLGIQIAQYISEKTRITTIAAVDINKALAGKDLGTFMGQEANGVQISNSLDEALNQVSIKPDVAIITTVSSIAKLESQIEEVAKQHIPIVSTCEELSYPWKQNREIAERIDSMCKKYDIACLGTGINPGFLMDYLPSVLSSVCKEVESIKVERFQDASPRRIPFQQKIGAGLSLEAFKAKELTGTLRHVGLKESVYFLAESLGFELDEVSEDLNPVIANQDIKNGGMNIPQGHARGVEQVAHGYINGNSKIEMHFKAAIGEPRSFDRVTIKGVPSFTSEIDTGVNGDVATCAITINSVQSILKASPGLHTMASVGLPGYLN